MNNDSVHLECFVRRGVDGVAEPVVETLFIRVIAVRSNRGERPGAGDDLNVCGRLASDLHARPDQLVLRERAVEVDALWSVWLN